MAIDETKLKVPAPTAADHRYAAIHAAISAIPLIGGPVVELLATILRPPIEKRRDEWMESVSLGLVRLDRRKRIDMVALSEDKQFIDAVLEATRIAIRTSKAEKLRSLRNTVLNSALGIEPDATIREMLLSQIEGLTSAHIEFLRWIALSRKWNTASSDGFAHTVPALKASPFLYRTIWKDLSDRGLIDSDAPVPSDQKTVITCNITEFGERLLRLVAVNHSPF